MSLFQRAIDAMREQGREVELTTQELFAKAEKRIAALEGKGTVEADTSVEDELKDRVSKLETAMASFPGASDVSSLSDRVTKLEAEVFGDGDGTEKAAVASSASSSASASPATKTGSSDAPAGSTDGTTAIDPAKAPGADAGAGQATVEQAAITDLATQAVDQTNGKSDPATNTAEDAPSMAPVPLPNTDETHPADPTDPIKAGVAAP